MLNTFIERQHSVVYTTRATTRLHDIPQGNPFGGPAFRKREDPITAAFAAVAAGTAGVAAIGTVIATIGIGATVVGMITGSKTLMRIGSVMGVVGGVMTMGASLFSGAAEGAATAGVEGAVSSGAGELTASELAADAISQTGMEAGGMIGSGVTEGASSLTGNIAEGGLTGADLGQSMAQNAITTNTPGSALSTSGAVSPAVANPLSTAAPESIVAQTPTAATVSAPSTVGAAAPAQPTSGWLDRMLNSDRVVQGALSMGGNVIQGVAGGLSQQATLDQQRKLAAEERVRKSAAGRLYGTGLISGAA